MTGKALLVDEISKLYRIGSASDLVSKDDNAVVRLLKKPLNNYRKYRSLYRFTDEELQGRKSGGDILWALRDVSFEVEPGEVVGLVGANGAGKSTLLKIISRVTPPTKGRCVTRGRVSCLLEVGTGFHPELTGRENIYMNSTILGMRKREVDRKFDEIVEFSGVKKFIDTPVKRYSSGMSVRLAFAVMAHLEPEILIIDEVLAVGDAEFQRKCLNQMGNAGRAGKTVLFVSHNMAAVTRLCDRGLLLRSGQIVQDGSAADVVHTHVSGGHGEAAAREWSDLESAPGDDKVRLRAIRIVAESGAPLGSADADAPVGIQITYDVLEGGQVLSPYFTIVSDAGVDLFSTTDADETADKVARKVGRYISTAWIPGGLLAGGTHYVRAVMRSVREQYRPFTERDIIAFNVIDRDSGKFGTGWWEGRPSGVISPRLQWSTEYVQPEMVIEG
ncbi:MAG: polysaccharide ABC transporter ATP-binding protein [Gammaproteobacteria bacterium]|nr:polysaccharide ABC transporter ATP-binding protein [Gammaproteobacteria bacterium]MDP6615771.1 polysaccharide ABC transporter ATP-binding protein [Gammaproteobacteria bacterium]MDP6695543.1 polysaccharide ABC transporter ATP-binding protein [Gammaproteobacteria bacterium]